MRHFSKKVLTILLIAVVALTGLSAQAIAEAPHGEYFGKTIILHSNDVHGAIEGYAKIAALRDAFEAKDAEVILIDNGDYSQGTTYVSIGKGANAIEMMNAVGYDYVGLGNHEFDFGYPQLVENMSKADFKVLCANVFGPDGKTIFDPYVIHTTSFGAKIGFFSLETPESQTKVNPALIKGLVFPAGKDMYAVAQKTVDELKAQGVDLIVCIAHLGIDAESEPNRSTDLLANVKGIDFLIDGHSHSTFSGLDGYDMQQTGTKFESIGVIELDNRTAEILDYYNVPCEGIPEEPEVKVVADEIIARINNIYGVKFAESKVALNGVKASVRTEETNMGDLIADALLWSATADPSALAVPVENVVAITNGGGIRASIGVGDITMKDINTVLPFGNTVAVVYVTGIELREALEASTYCTPSAIGGFPQIAGMNITINTRKAYAKRPETYPESTYYGPAVVRRVKINTINGKPWTPFGVYAVVTNNFLAAGGDTYYAFKAASAQYDSSIPMDDVVMSYITEVLGGVIDERYAEPQGRMRIIK
ncbi:MAG: bifunctional metallophosphatase/5'-nucleotidase [Sphaerochaetaceae bacterium]|nr:bifunctional metallophosphatase/5'-nucleotidase [Sphaerochaetaceae bacterium]